MIRERVLVFEDCSTLRTLQTWGFIMHGLDMSPPIALAAEGFATEETVPARLIWQINLDKIIVYRT